MDRNGQDAGASTSFEKTVQILNLAWDARWALRVSIITLCFDMALLLYVDKGLWQWAEIDKAVVVNFGWLAVCLMIFTLLMSIVLPSLLIIMRRIIEGALGLWSHSSSETRKYSRPLGYVFASHFRKFALEENNEFLWRIYEQHAGKKNKAEEEIEEIGKLVAMFVLALMADYVIGSYIQNGVGLVKLFISTLGDWAYIAISYGIICACIVLKNCWFPGDSFDLIEYPPLDNKLRAEERGFAERK